MARKAQWFTYPINFWKAVEDREEEAGISLWVVRQTDRHDVHQHLVQAFGEQRFWQLSQVVLEHSCDDVNVRDVVGREVDGAGPPLKRLPQNPFLSSRTT